MKKRPIPKGVILHSKKGKRVFRGLRWDIYQWEQKMFTGKMGLFETLARREATVVIMPVITKEEAKILGFRIKKLNIKEDPILVLGKEIQPHWPKSGFGFPAGGVHENEDLEVAARRELQEETGLVFKDFYLVDVHQFLGGIEWFAYTFIAKN